MSNFNSRLLVGAIYVATTAFCLLFDQLTAWLFFGVLQALVLYEWYAINRKSKSKRSFTLPLLIGSIVFLMVYGNQDSVVNMGTLVYLLIPIFLLFFIWLIFYKSDHFVKDAAVMIAGWIYISASFAFFLRIGNLTFNMDNTDLLPYHGFQILLIFILIWVNDTGAYLVGRRWGKTPLAPVVSPKKTWEGFVGGLVLSVLVGLIISHYMAELEWIHYLVLAVICSVFGTLGDLFESKVKRSLAIKDSGTLLGGHGGVLDRFDSILFAGPAAYFYLLHFIVM
ncbi:MAG: phosphatidate cytidylyltransferase [Bacteroidia bacterium]|jgi:phosphatidate cytidylyltransferase